MKIGTAEVIRQIDRYCIEKLGIPSIVLMENAALKVVKNLDTKDDKTYTVVCGTGNNGGDGFAVARHLYSLGKEVEIFIITESEIKMSVDCKINYEILKNMGVKVGVIRNMEDVTDLRDSLTRNNITIDAIFGTGLHRKIDGIYDLVISIINENSEYIVSIDVPSGFNSNTGEILGNCIKANRTISFQLYKEGFLNYGTDKFTGEIIIEDIGIPDSAVDKFHQKYYMMDKNMIVNRIGKRDKYSHKGDYGRILILAGSDGFTGAAYISTMGAVRSGAGLVTLCCGKNIQDILSNKLVEAMTINDEQKDKLIELILKSDAIAIGPGMGNNNRTLELLRLVIHNATCPVIIDADGINVLKNDIDLLKKKKKDIIITPHVGEMATLTGLSVDYIVQNRIQVAKSFAKEYEIIVLLKGYNTIITDGENILINPTGNSSMASGGMGDCLTGMVSSLVGQGYLPISAACIATFIHGYCGDILSKDMFCVNASHLLEQIPYTIKKFQKYSI